MANEVVPYAQPVQTQIVDYAEPGVMHGPQPQAEDDLPRLIQYYEEAEEAQRVAREKAERDRDYVDNKQWTQEEVDKLAKRGQPAISLNMIRSRASFLGGMEKKQRRDPKAYPRNNPDDAPAAEAFTDGLRYAAERADYASKRSAAWKNIVVEGFGGVEIAAVMRRDGTYDFTIESIPWDRAFYDPHSGRPDFKDARYLGQVLWMDEDEALTRAVAAGYVDEVRAREILETTIATGVTVGAGRTFDDKPKNGVWADAKRRRVRIVMMWHRETDGWKYCEFTKGGKLAYADGPYVDQDGDTICPWIIESANVDRDNNRYGEVRHLIDPQDEVNKRRSKALHNAVSRGVVATKGAVADVAATRRELAKPDFYIEVDPSATKFELVSGVEMAAGQAQLLQQAMQYFMEAGPNGALLGKGTEDQSGRAIEAQQAGGLVEQSDLMDTLRRFDWRVFNALASMMKQFWTAEKWVRVTDDDETPRWVGFNVPMWTMPDTGETLPEPEWKKRLQAGEQIPVERLVPAANDNGQAALHNNMAELDMDIMVSDAPATVSLDGPAYGALLDLLKAGLPPQVLKLAIEMHPGLPIKRKKQLTDMMDQMANQPPPPGADKKQALEEELADAKIVLTRAQGYAALAAGEASLAKAGHVEPLQPPLPSLDGPGDMGAMPPQAAPGPVPGPGGPPMPDPGSPPPGPAPAPTMGGPGPAEPAPPAQPMPQGRGPMTGGPLAA